MEGKWEGRGRDMDECFTKLFRGLADWRINVFIGFYFVFLMTILCMF